MNPLIPISARRLPWQALIVVLLIFLNVTFAPCRAEEGPDHQALTLLGQQLFLDTALSQDGKESCATCHKPDRSFTDGRRVAVGIHQHIGTRNTPSLLALSGAPFFWDGRASELEAAVIQPFTNPVEMGLPSSEALLRKIQNSHYYRVAFLQAFPNASPHSTLAHTAQALAAYVQSLNRGSNAYDDYRAGDNDALPPEAARGLAVFGGTAHCADCHRLDGKPAAFTDLAFHSTLLNPKLAAQLPSAAVNLTNQTIAGSELNARIESDPLVSELGRFLVTHDPKDIGSFRTPSLRNVALTAPYMHDGSAATLRDAVDREIHYRSLQINQANTVTEQDRRDVVAFLEALTDQPRHNALNEELDALLLPF